MHAAAGASGVEHHGVLTRVRDDPAATRRVHKGGSTAARVLVLGGKSRTGHHNAYGSTHCGDYYHDTSEVLELASAAARLLGAGGLAGECLYFFIVCSY